MYIFVLKNTKGSNNFKIFRKKKRFFSINFIAPFTTDTYFFETDKQFDIIKFLYLECNIIKNKSLKKYIESNNFENNINFLKKYHSKYKNIIYFGNNIYQKIDFDIKSYSKLPKGNKVFIKCY